MHILSIETSCDETAISIIKTAGSAESPRFEVLGNALYSQAKTHAEYGGVFPALAKREHARNMVPLLKMALEVAYKNGLPHTPAKDVDEPLLIKTLEREGDMASEFVEFVKSGTVPLVDAIAVTSGPGLEPALWVGINTARALNLAWNIPVVPVNHMEGHIMSVLIDNETMSMDVQFPALALLISGGHTELVEIKNWHDYTVLGRTRDDAVGEAFDKVARLLGLPYPGGPHVSKLAAEYRKKNGERMFDLPRPMITSKDFDFSFSGIKTSVLYTLKKLTDITPLSDEQKSAMACEFENAVTEVLVAKTARALDETGAQTLIIGGGVVANTYIRAQFEKLISSRFPHVSLRVPSFDLSTDNSIMIAVAGYFQVMKGLPNTDIVANGNLSL